MLVEKQQQQQLLKSVANAHRAHQRGSPATAAADTTATLR